MPMAPASCSPPAFGGYPRYFTWLNSSQSSWKLSGRWPWVGLCPLHPHKQPQPWDADATLGTAEAQLTLLLLPSTTQSNPRLCEPPQLESQQGKPDPHRLPGLPATACTRRLLQEGFGNLQPPGTPSAL